LVELRDRVDTLESSLYNTRADYLRLSNAVAKICPDRNKFFADLIPDEDDHIGEVNKKVTDLANYPESPDSSLVERVTAAIEKEQGPYRFGWGLEAKAAIREIAAWLSEQGTNGLGWSIRLEQEVNHD
jgi:rubrerythrin